MDTLFDLSGLESASTAMHNVLPEIRGDWLPPTELPNLSSAVAIAVDCETKETDFDHGPGWARGKGHIVGVSLAAVDRNKNRGKWYFPLRHTVQPELNLNPESVFRYLREVLSTDVPKVGANLMYDLGWLAEEGVTVNGKLYDVQAAEALLSESGRTALEVLGQKYLGMGKESPELYAWCAAAYGGKPNGKQRSNIWRAPPTLVGPYAESDADLPLRIIEKQWGTLESEGLMDVFRMENALTPLLIRMRQEGVTIDVAAAEKMYDDLGPEIDSLNHQLSRMVGREVNVNSGSDLAIAFDRVGLPYKKTSSGAPSFRKEFLATVDHPLGKLIREIREHTRIRDTFIKSYLLDSHVNGKIYCQFHPLRSEKGTRSGRLSSSDPNLQNTPGRTELGKRVRSLFIPDPGHFTWQKADYSQIEYRFLAHFAVGEGADALRDEYNKDPTTDYHKHTQQLVKAATGMDVARKPIKAINFGLLYGMGKKTLAKNMGVAADVSEEISEAYHAGAPYVKATMDAAAEEVRRLGYITTIMGRRSRFELWEPKTYSGDKDALPHSEALRVYGSNITRAHTHKAINRRLQGSSADLLKKAMVDCFEAGIFDATGIPRLTVHDELDFSVPDDSAATREAYREMKHVMETAIELRIPALVDVERGPSWGTVK